MSEKIPFRPVVGKEEKILNSQLYEGMLAFATDTKKIFYNDGENNIPMGGNSGIYYANKTWEDTPETGQIEFYFTVDDIESGDTPSEDDLILNISDGGFYRVMEVNTTEDGSISIKTNRLAIAGGGGSNVGPSQGGITFKQVTKRNSVALYGRDYQISFYIKATDYSGEATSGGYMYVKIEDTVAFQQDIVNDSINTFEIGSYLTQYPVGQEIKVSISAFVDVGTGGYTEVTSTWYVTTTAAQLTWKYNEGESYQLNDLSSDLYFNYSVTGNLNKRVTVIINNNYNNPIVSEEFTSSENKIFRITQLPTRGFSHGAHKVEMYAEVELVKNEWIKSNSITHTIIIAETGNTNTIIGYDFYDKTITQYNTVKIPIIVYSASNTAGTLALELKEGNKVVDVWENVINLKPNDWSYTPTESGDKILTLQSGLTQKSIEFYVEPVSLKVEEPKDYIFKFKANEFASNTAIQNWNSNGINADFINFDWVNGGLKTESDPEYGVRSYFSIKSGSKMIINHQLFKNNPATSGLTLKLIFKATRCKSYDAEILKCVEQFGSNYRGIILKANGGTYYADNSLNLSYSEDSYIELEIDITPSNQIAPSGVKMNYITGWIDGIPMGVIQYGDATMTHQNLIEIGSNDCDVSLYMIKVYQRHLSNNEHLANFIMDAPNAQEMLKRYDRNDILNPETGEIDPQLLSKKNPNCKVHLYEIEAMTTTKNDPKKVYSYRQYQNGRLKLKADSPQDTDQGSIKMKVQGTSSAAYGPSAFNVDVEFSLTNQDGDIINEGTSTLYEITDDGKEVNLPNGWSMNENSIPCTYFTTKVNVASCENANNALNQEYYNRFQPYLTLARAKNNKRRDCMEFTPGVMFIKDLNQTSNDSEAVNNNVFKEIEGYIASPFFKQYAICNMGNSKDNIHVFHDLENPLDCCIENGDNQLPGQQMTAVQGSYEYIENNDKGVPVTKTANVILNEENGLAGETYCEKIGTYKSNLELWEAALDNIYEFRYPDGIKDLKKKYPDQAPILIEGWYRFVSWMAHSNPQPKYEKIKIVNEDNFNEIKKSKTIYKMNGDISYDVVEQYESDNEEYYVATPHIYGYDNLRLPEGDAIKKTFAHPGFQGYKADEEKQKNYTPLIKDIKESVYNGTYTHDTFEYRMAKMIDECEDYLVLDSVVYHYLFIQRHSMIDNVAKNTFWSTEDGRVWNLTRNYDNDTADGNDNNGHLTIPYGREPGDVKADGTSLFNAGNSVWLNFIKNLPASQQQIFTALDTSARGYAWDSNHYLKTFKDWQSAIPERCWIEDYYRKYFRPYEVYKLTTYLPMLEGGLKTHQREHYEKYQDMYISSKYLGHTAQAGKILVRPNAKDFSGKTIIVAPYADCYLSAGFGVGTGKTNWSKRVKRNEQVVCGEGIDIADATNATTYLYPSGVYSQIGGPADRDENGNIIKYNDLRQWSNQQLELASANKLVKVYLGEYREDGRDIVPGLNGLSLSGNDLLEEIYACGYQYKNVEGILQDVDLNLEDTPNLKILDARQSNISTVKIANNAPVTEMKLKDPQTLILTNLTELENLSIEDYGDLVTLQLDNIDTSEGINSKNLVKAAQNLRDYKLKNIIWNLDNTDTVTDNSIGILDRLLGLDLVSGENYATALTGIINIPENVYNGTKSQELYEKYIFDGEKVYLNLDLNFEGSAAKLYNIYIYNGDGRIQWKRKIKIGGLINNNNFYNNGPLGAFNVDELIKSSTATTDFNFTKQFKIGDSDTLINWNDSGYLDYSDPVTTDLHLYPIYDEKERIYTVNYFNNEIKIATLKMTYGAKIYNESLKIVPYKEDDNNLALEEVYGFVGWATENYKNTPVANDYTLISTETIQNFYAVFEKMSVYNNIHEEYFEIVPGSDGVLKLKSGLSGLKGKITIPSSIQNVQIKTIQDGAFQGQNNLTHVFLSKNNSINAIGSAQAISAGTGVFDNCRNLKYFDFKYFNGTIVGGRAFFNCNLIQQCIQFNNIEYIYTDAFNNGFSDDEVSKFVWEIALPSTIKGINKFAIANNTAKDLKVKIGSKDKPLTADIATTQYRGFRDNDGSATSIWYWFDGIPDPTNGYEKYKIYFGYTYDPQNGIVPEEKSKALKYLEINGQVFVSEGIWQPN